LCGRVVCGDPATSCSNEVGLDVDARKPRPNLLSPPPCAHADVSHSS
jgi:hypothetical protein